jgi:predicted nucleotide-binding protein
MPRVFIAYGRDFVARDAVSKYLTGLGIQPVVFSEVADYGKTVIEKFEDIASRCEFAIILLTPDDKQVHDPENNQSMRARQNVIFEMGWFFGRLGRRKTLLLRRGNIELPSDVEGVLFKQYRVSPLEVGDEIVAALRAGGVVLRQKL